MSADTMAVEVTGLGKRFGRTTALDDVSFSVAPAELFGLVGPDGGGKTTLFRILSTLLVADAGQATVLGGDVIRDLWRLRTQIGYMPGRFSLYGDLTVQENLEFFASVFGTSLAEGRQLIAPIYSQIERFHDRRAAALSGGMKQKLALCCALVHRPQILFLDEPTTGVDAVSRREFWDLLETLQQSGLTIVVSTPYMDEAVRCDRVALLQAGRVLALDTPLAIGQRFPRPLFAVASRQRMPLLRALRELPDAASALPFGNTVHYSDRRTDAAPQQVMEELTQRLRLAGIDDVTVEPIAAGIEDVFIELMGTEPAVAA